MDFDQAISKLERDHSNLKRMAKSKAAEKERLQRNAASRRKIVEKQLALERKRMQKLNYLRKCNEEYDASLLLENKKWLLEPTSIHGDGDKIALPESLLQQIIMDNSASKHDVEVLEGTFSKSDPLIFRIGIINPEYDPMKHFPMSQGMHNLMNNYRPDDEVDEDAMVMVDSNERKGQGVQVEEEVDNDKLKRDAYLDDLCCKYLAYTYCTVVEFTQEEGRVGLPQAISTALLTGQRITTPSQQRKSTPLSDLQQKLQDLQGQNYIVPFTRTIEPPSKGEEAPSIGGTSKFHKGQYVVYTKEQIIVKISNVHLDEELVPYYDIQTLDGCRDIQTTDNYLELFRNSTAETNDGSSSMGGGVTDSTTGHTAYGAFDIPNVKVELTLVRPRAIPKGTGCTLVPSMQSASEFSRLPNIKTALEQSLIRTRATLSLNDIVYCWYRGKKFDLRVSNVIPMTWGVVSCINTDMEVNIDYHDDISPTDGVEPQPQDSSSADDTMPDSPLDTGTNMLQKRNLDYISRLPPEPDAEVDEGNVCTIMIRAGAGISDSQPHPQKRRFDRNTATLQDIHIYAAHVCNLSESDMDSQFQLVSRFPRIVFHNSPSILLADSGLQSGQHLLLVERKLS